MVECFKLKPHSLVICSYVESGKNWRWVEWSFNFAVLFGFLTSIPLIFSSVYNFSSPKSGLPFIAIAVGCLLSILTMSLLDRALYQKQYQKCITEGRRGVPPEYRLYEAMAGGIGLPVSLL
jgi:hypothetical protein